MEMFGKRCDIRKLTKADMERWRDWLLHDVERKDVGRGEYGLAPKTVKEHLDWVAAVCNYSEIANPCKHVERPRKTEAERQESLEFFTQNEMERMFSVCATETPRFYNAFVVFALTGCRTGEIQSLRPEHLDVSRHAVWVTGKGDRRRQLILTGPLAPAWTALIQQISERPRLDGFFFPRSPTWARKAVARLSKKAFGVDDEGKATRHGKPHMLRHTFATMALLHWQPTWEIARLAKWLGHSDVSTTFRIYGHLIGAEPPSGFGFKIPEKCKQSVSKKKSAAVGR